MKHDGPTRGRREFITATALAGIAAAAPCANAEDNATQELSGLEKLEREFGDPPREFTVLPFWFWNDVLDKEELARQIADFEAHGVHGFTIHPRIGLPEDAGWMSAKLLDAMRFALEEARKRDMIVLLYDEGMYPSGSSAGQVVAEDPSYAARGFIRVPVDAEGKSTDAKLQPGDDWNFACEYTDAKGGRWFIYDAPSGGVIRGLHYIGDESNRPREFSPPAADLLNPGAVDTFIRLVYQRFYDEFEEYFKSGTVIGIFTDEPSILGRGSPRGMRAGNLQSLPTISRYFGEDFLPKLPHLFEDISPESGRIRAEYDRAVRLALEEIYYGRISDWCVRRNTSLCGHPEGSTDVGVLRKFQIPGQDIVWRYIEPGEKAFDPGHSPMAKVASSAMIHNGARRNLNEIFGAYGHEFTYDEMVWLINWCVARGQNMFVPHAFYYSIRGPRFEERPPDVGPHAAWWPEYKTFADYCARLCWLNTDSRCVAPVAMLTDSARATSWSTKTLIREQIDFNYLELRSLEEAEISEDGIRIRDAFYSVALIPPGPVLTNEARKLLAPMAGAGRVIRLTDKASGMERVKTSPNDAELLKELRGMIGWDVETFDVAGARRDPIPTSACPGLRVRHVVKSGTDMYFLFNEEDDPIDVFATFAADAGTRRVRRWNPWTGEISPVVRNEQEPQVFRLDLAKRQATIVAFDPE